MILDAIHEIAERRPGAPAIFASGDVLGYADLARAIRDRAAALRPRAGAIATIRDHRPLHAVVDALAVRSAGGVPLVLAPDGGAAPEVAAPLPPGTAWLKTTGGSTAAPRLIALDEAQADSIARLQARLCGYQAGAVLAVTVPPWTAYGWTCWVGALVAGATVQHVPPAALRDLLDALAGPDTAWGCTTPPVVRALARLAGRPGSRGAPLLCSTAAYPVAEAAEVLARHGVPVIERYGCAEAGTIAQAPEPGAALRPAPGVAIRVAGEPPTLEVRSASIGIGLVGGPRWDGVFKTADEIDLGPDGSFRLRGRADRIVKRMGRAVDLDAIERLLCAQPGVERARVRVERTPLDIDLVAQVIPLTGAAPPAAALAAGLADTLAPWERPSRIEIVDARAGGDPAKWRSRDS